MAIFNTSGYESINPRRLLGLIGLDRETAPTLLFIMSCIPMIALVILWTHGNIVAAFVPVALMALVLFTIYRIDYSLFALVGFVLLFDQFHIPGFWPYTFRIDYFRNLKEISYLPAFSAGVVNPVEIHFLLILFVWFITLCIKKKFAFSRIPVWGALLLFAGWLTFSFAYGLKNGGDFLTALWEVRALFYFILFYIAIPQVVQTKRRLNILLWIIIGAISLKAFQGIARFAVLGFSFQGLPTLTNHEDPVFITTLLTLLFSLLLYRVKNAQRNVLLLLFFPLLIGFYVAQRRAAIASFLVSMGSLFVLLPGLKQWKFFKIAIPVVAVALVYGAMFWNSNSKWAGPVQMIKSGIAASKEDLSKADYYSNLYRQYEDYNLAYTFRKHPVMGTGFGKKYEQPLRLANISFPLRDYIPHNQIFWVIVKSGAVGFFLFWFFFNSFAFQGICTLRRLNSPYLKSVCIMIVVAIINQMVVSFYDLQLTYYRNMIYLGTLMGLMPVLQKIDKKEVKHVEGAESQE